MYSILVGSVILGTTKYAEEMSTNEEEPKKGKMINQRVLGPSGHTNNPPSSFNTDKVFKKVGEVAN